MEKKRSAGVLLISICEIAIGGLPLLFYLASMLIDIKYAPMLILLGLFYLPLPILMLITGIQTYKLKPAGRLMNLILAYLMLIINIAIMIPKVPFIREFARRIYCRLYPINQWVVILFVLFLIYFFTRPKVKEQFK